MGRDVHYSPFATWHQNQSTAHNRFLKFLLVIILLSLVSFYIGYPDSNIDETPKTEPQEYRAREITNDRYSESTRNDEVPIQTASTIVQNTAGQSLNQTQNLNNQEFNESRVPSGPSFGDKLAEEKLKILEEQERKIIESQEMESVKDGHQEDLAVANVGVEGIGGQEAPVSQEAASSLVGVAETITASQTPEIGAGTESQGEEAKENGTELDFTISAIGSTESPKSEEFESGSQPSTPSDIPGEDGLVTSTSETQKSEAPGSESGSQPSTPSDIPNDDAQQSEQNSDGPETVESESTTTDISFTTSSLFTDGQASIEIEEAEKQVEQVSSNKTVIVEGSQGNLEVTTVGVTSEAGNVTESSSQLEQAGGQDDEEKEQKMFENLSECQVEDWNNVTTDQVPHESVFKQWLSPIENNETNAPKVLGAFAYHSHIAVTLSSRNFSTEKVYCRYYDCHKKQMVRQMVSFVFPESTVYCPRRAGAKYISISESLEDKGQFPVQILKRLVPHHFFTVCLGVNDENILKLARFVEYYKLQGATFFHVYLKNSSHYQRMLLDDYVRTGDVKVVKIGENVTEEVQANDCQHRNKYFSKWTAFLNLEDQLEAKEEAETISSVLDSIHDHKTNILKWGNETTRLIIRPERIVSVNQSPLMIYLGNQLSETDKPSGIFKEFATTPQLLTLENFSENLTEDVPFREELVENVLNRTKYVFATIETDDQQSLDQNQDTTSEVTSESTTVAFSNIDSE